MSNRNTEVSFKVVRLSLEDFLSDYVLLEFGVESDSPLDANDVQIVSSVILGIYANERLNDTSLPVDASEILVKEFYDKVDAITILINNSLDDYNSEISMASPHKKIELLEVKLSQLNTTLTHPFLP